MVAPSLLQHVCSLYQAWSGLGISCSSGLPSCWRWWVLCHLILRWGDRGLWSGSGRGQDWNPGLLLPGLVASGSSLHLPELTSSISKMGLAGSTSVEWCQGQNTPHGAWLATGVLWEMLLSVWESVGPTSPYSTPEPFGGFEQHSPALEPQFPHL